MSWGLLGGVVGAAIGYFTPIGPYYGWLIGSTLGSIADASNQPDQVGPRLEDLKVQVSSYGVPIPVIYGSVRIAGNVIWTTDLIEVENSESAKGGGPDVTSFTYFVSCAVGLCEGEIAGVARIWANKKLIYDARASNTGAVKSAAIHGLRVYTGSESQTADSLIVAHKGSSPAYRGLAYVVFELFDTSEFGNRLPQFEFEVLKAATSSLPAVTNVAAAGGAEPDGTIATAALDPVTNYIWTAAYVAPDIVRVKVIDNAALATVATIDKTMVSVSGTPGDSVCYVTIGETREMWVANENGEPNLMVFSADALAWSRNIHLGIAWYGRIRFEPQRGYVWLCRTNLTSRIYVIEPFTGTEITNFATPASGLGGIQEVLFLPDGSAAVLTAGHLYLYDVYTFGVITDYTLTTSASSGGRMSYDSSRNRLVITHGGAAVYTVLDLTAGTITDYTITSSHLQTVMWHEQNDRYYIIDTFSAAWTLYTIDPAALGSGTSQVYAGPSGAGTMIEVDETSDYFLNVDWASGNNYVERIPLAARLTPSTTTLAAIVQDIATRPGLLAGDLDVTALTDTVDGYVWQQTRARSAIEPLQAAFFFDGVESDDKLKFVMRGGAIAVTIPEDERAAHEPSAEIPDALRIIRAQEHELPVHCDVEFFDKDGDYQIGNQYDRRITRNSEGVLNLRLPIVMSATKAKQVAMVNLYEAWLRARFNFTTSRKYAKYEPTDVVTLPTANATYNARIVAKREGANGVIEFEARIEDSALYTQTGTTQSASYVPQTVYAPPATLLRLLDIPMLRDVDDDAGFYAAAAGASSSWPGARLFKSTDAGASYADIESLLSAATMGAAQTALGNFSGGFVFDELNSVTVLMQNGTLANATELQVLNGANIAVLGDEIIAFKTATLGATDTYTLTGLLRGLRGTEWAINTHAVGDRFVLASTSTWRRIAGSSAEIGLERHYKAPTLGRPLSSVTATAFSNTARALECYAPVELGGGRDASGDLTITWVRRSRISGAWRDYVDVPLGETTESYEVEIWDSSFATLKRTITGLSSATASYTAAQQTTDFGGAQSTVYAKVYQLSATVGRGYALQGSV